jgi:endonuclease III
MSTTFRFSPGGRERLRLLDRALHETYCAPESSLGNKADPLGEAVYIVLSFQTDLARFKETWANLQSTFPTWEALKAAPVQDVANALRAGGLQEQKAVIIQKLLRSVEEAFGELSLDSLRELSDDEAEKALLRLPGLSWKGARCVLLYSFDRSVFPVDVNTFRVLQRVSVIPRSAIYRRRSLHDGLQSAVEPARRRHFHVNLVVHGQTVCLPQRPFCHACPAAAWCPRRDVPPPAAGHVSRERSRLDGATTRLSLKRQRPAPDRRAPDVRSSRGCTA